MPIASVWSDKNRRSTRGLFVSAVEKLPMESRTGVDLRFPSLNRARPSYPSRPPAIPANSASDLRHLELGNRTVDKCPLRSGKSKS